MECPINLDTNISAKALTESFSSIMQTLHGRTMLVITWAHQLIAAASGMHAGLN
jgi:hypothetical protein